MQPYIVKYCYTIATDPDKLFSSQTFCRDLEDGIRRAHLQVDGQKGSMHKLWLVDLQADDPVLELIIGKDEGDSILSIDQDRVISSLYANYKKDIKEPKKLRALRAKETATRMALRAAKPRIKLKNDQPPLAPKPKPPEEPPFRAYQIVLASDYTPPLMGEKATAIPPITDVEDIDPWEHVGLGYD